jgi:hypothetical protein
MKTGERGSGKFYVLFFRAAPLRRYRLHAATKHTLLVDMVRTAGGALYDVASIFLTETRIAIGWQCERVLNVMG